MLKDLKLRITSPNECNDPFELTPRSKFTITVSDMVNRAKTNPDHYRGAFEDMQKDGYPQSFSQLIADLPRMLNFTQFKKKMKAALVEKDMQALALLQA